MDYFFYRAAAWAAVFAGLFGAGAHASTLDTIGVTLLRTVTTNVNGAGINVGQAEVSENFTDPTKWQVDPGMAGQPVSRFTYFVSPTPSYTSVNSTNNFPNLLGNESDHAGYVAGNFFGMPGGVATNVAHVDNYEANTFINYYVNQGHAISNRIVNQSFTYDSYNTDVDQIYDNYAAQNGVLFVSGAGIDTHPVASPATCYNGIGVGVAGYAISPSGPTPDGRSKPDIVAPGTPPDDSVTSYATPMVAGAAALLMQAGLRGDGGSSTTTNLAVDIRTLKALLLNGAVKEPDWTNSPATPLHPVYGTGVLNVFNSYRQLTGGRHGYIVSTSVTTNSPHWPTGAGGTISVLSGWDFNTNSSSATTDGVNHYYFNATNSANNTVFTATATLVWNRHKNTNIINNLNLFLYDTLSSNLVACSTSLVDNVEHLWLPQLPQGRYDLQVLKRGGTTVTTNETYALAWEFFSQSLQIAASGANASLAWPVYPAGFVVESTTNLTPPAVWTTNGISSPVVTNNQNYILFNAVPSGGTNQFFRLRRP